MLFKNLNQFILGIVFLLSFNPANAETEWQVGLGVGNIDAPAYVGSKERILLTRPIPYFKIRTETFDMSRGSLNFNFFPDTPYRLSFNFDVGLPVESDDIPLRAGMDDLDAVLQIGPMLTYQFDMQNPSTNLKLEFPVLLAYSLGGGSPEPIGGSVTPRLAFNIEQNNEIGIPLNLGVSLGPVFGAEELHQYYYSVNTADVTANRALYTAESGYAGYRINFAMTKKMGDFWVGAYLRYQNLSEATFVDSPLVDEDEYWLITFAMRYVFAGNMKD